MTRRRRFRRAIEPGRTVSLSALALVGLVLAVTVVSACDADRADAVRAYNEGMHAFESAGASAAAQHMELALEEDPTFTADV